jgi:trimeric autotransporter adhesin
MPGGLTGTVTHFQDNQAQTNFWAAFLAEANTINAHLTAIAGGQEQATADLVTQIQNYQQFGANFDAAQGAIFQGRFDNELNNGTLEADSAAAVKGLTGILNGDTGAALAADQAMITAAGQGFAADAMDVSGNNTAIGGASYVGTATTVATATSVNGLAQGTIPVTATPNIANGTGGTVVSGTTGGAATGGGTGAGGGAGAGAGNTQNPGSGAAAGSGDADDGAGAGAAQGGAGGCGGCGHDQAGHHGNTMLNDIAALLQALQNGNSAGVNSAVTALGNDVHNASAADVGNLASAFTHSHFEHMWH